MPFKVMLVEDNHALLTLLETFFMLEGFEVVRGPQQAEALLAALQQERPQVLVMDVRLQGEVSGLDLLDAIRQDPDLRTMAVILTSGMDFREEAMRHGADGFLIKPFMPDELLYLVRSLTSPSAPPGIKE